MFKIKRASLVTLIALLLVLLQPMPNPPHFRRSSHSQPVSGPRASPWAMDRPFMSGPWRMGRYYRGDLLTGETSVLVAGQAGRVTVGLSFDDRSGYLFAAGGRPAWRGSSMAIRASC